MRNCMTTSLSIGILLGLFVAREVRCAVVTRNVTYFDDQTELRGYLAYDDSWDESAPAVVIIQDWDGITLYEQQRAEMIVGLGYVAFCADIYEVDSGTDYYSLYLEYTGNATKYLRRMNLGIQEAKSFSFVDSTMVAAIGYCFGGTGVINLATAGVDLRAVVSFHGGLTRRAEYTEGTAIPAVVSIHSGGSDDSASDIQQLQDNLTAGNASWEVTRYGGVLHAFTMQLARLAI
ncbi:hypothetical protein CYMTET_26702 [Cymbomonas tetramitiformis]|uniref:Dienelactone hydrolase domain-containing protein n=1 Tax=Cymbomonas tetramitiformis TaxID=36881 RepID=A0AAE0FS01_9CHLO|nr:hypothetical protein CYMTET_26702 [Cymbomonas tetramitiformis]